MLNSQETRILLETSYDRLKSREITFQPNTGENLAKAGVFPLGLQTSLNIKEILLYL